jgi:hypothetical protein
MPTKPLDRLMFAQGGLCFFCKGPLPQSEASVEHLVASANGGSNNDENCVACCKSLNALFGSMSLKEMIQLVLNQKGQFKCPNKTGARKALTPVPVAQALLRESSKSPPEKLAAVVADLHKRGLARPRTVKTLTSTISALFQKQLSDQEVSSLIERLKTQGIVTVSGTKVSYELPHKVA